MPDTATPTDSGANTDIGFKQLSPLVGSEVVGADLSQPLSDEGFAAIRRELCERSVLVIRDQHLTAEQQISFSARFGKLEHHVLNHYCHPDHPEIFMVSNIKEDGKHIGAYDGSKNYHIDLAYMRVPSLGSVFTCLEHPPSGVEHQPLGRTGFGQNLLEFGEIEFPPVDRACPSGFFYTG